MEERKLYQQKKDNRQKTWGKCSQLCVVYLTIINPSFGYRHWVDKLGLRIIYFSFPAENVHAYPEKP